MSIANAIKHHGIYVLKYNMFLSQFDISILIIVCKGSEINEDLRIKNKDF